MEKKKIIKTIFHKINYERPIPYRMYRHLIEDCDIVYAGHEDEHWSENNGTNAYYFLTITRKVLETDEEFEHRKKETKHLKEEYKERRYHNYLKLKEEFENE